MHICKTFTFDAAHRLNRLPSSHKCHNLHGHTYRVDIIVEGVLNEFGWIMDYADIGQAWQSLFDQLDHKYLNDVAGLEVPTTEVLAMWIFRRLGEALGRPPNYSMNRDPNEPGRWLSRVRVYESSTTYCEVP